MVENIGRTGRTNVADMIRNYNRYPADFGRVPMPQMGRGRDMRGLAGRIQRFGRGMVGGDTPVTRQITPISDQYSGKVGPGDTAIIAVQALSNILKGIENYRAAQAAAKIARENNDGEAEERAVEMAKENQAMVLSLLDKAEKHPNVVTAVLKNMAEKGPEGLREIARELSDYDFAKENEERAKAKIEHEGALAELKASGATRGQLRSYASEITGKPEEELTSEDIQKGINLKITAGRDPALADWMAMQRLLIAKEAAKKAEKKEERITEEKKKAREEKFGTDWAKISKPFVEEGLPIPKSIIDNFNTTHAGSGLRIEYPTDFFSRQKHKLPFVGPPEAKISPIPTTTTSLPPEDRLPPAAQYKDKVADTADGSYYSDGVKWKKIK